MHHGIDAMGESALDHCGVAQIPSHHINGLARQAFNPAQRLRCAVGEVIQHNQLMASLLQHHSGVAANETSPACQQKSCHRLILLSRAR